MQSIVFDDKTTQTLFGHEAAEDEDPQRLQSYYFRSNIYDRATADLPLRVLVGHKGLGKSALFEVARHKDAADHNLAMLLRPDDVHEVSTSANMLESTRNWKSGLLRIIYDKCIQNLAFAPNSEAPDWANQGVRLADQLAKVVAPSIAKYVNIDEAKRTAAKKFLDARIVRVYIDDLDRGWTASRESITRLSSLLNAARDLVKEHPGLQFRIALRTDVYFLVRTSDESTDKIEGSVVWYSWSNHEILAMLVKRVQSFFGREMSELELTSMPQDRLADLLDQVIEPRFRGYGKWENIPTHRMLMSLIRRRPRDLVKLCTSAAHSAFSRGSQKIGTTDFAAVFEQYSQGRLQDTINEYRSELPGIDRLLLAMKPSRQRRQAGRPFLFTTADLLKKLKDIMSSSAPFQFHGGQIAGPKDLAAFLFKINFLTGRKEIDGRIERSYFEENQYLSSAFVDFGYDWEIHPAYRWALQPGEVNSTTQSIDT